jgi:hypothetical protein
MTSWCEIGGLGPGECLQGSVCWIGPLEVGVQVERWVGQDRVTQARVVRRVPVPQWIELNLMVYHSSFY